MANRSGGGTRMGKQWDSILALQQAVSASGTFIGSALGSTTAQTVLRMLGEYLINSTGVAVAGDQCRVTMAIGVVSSDAFAAGAGSLPDPGGEPDYPWLYWASHNLMWPAAVSGTAGEGAPSIAGVVRKAFDIKSMRRMKPRESLVWVGEYQDVSGTPPIQVSISQTRVLIGLH